MALRNDLVYDEDDYVPPGYVPPKPSSRTKPLVAVVITGLVIGAIVVMFVMRSRDRTRFARIERARAAQAAMATTQLRRAFAQPGEEVGSRQYSSNWQRIVGTWSRVAGPDEMHYPIRFEFSEGPSTITFGDNRVLEVRFIVRREDHESIVLEAQPRVIAEGRDVILYHFKFRTDGSIVLNDSMGGLVYTREEANPARLGMPRR